MLRLWSYPPQSFASRRNQNDATNSLADMSALQMPLNKLILAIARAIEAAHGIKVEA